MKKRVEIPRKNPKALLTLAAHLHEKHLADGDASPLKALNWTNVAQLIENATTADAKADQLRREKLMTFQQRDLYMEQLIHLLRNSRDILTGVHADQMKMLGEWGFNVLDNRSKASAISEISKVQKSA